MRNRLLLFFFFMTMGLALSAQYSIDFGKSVNGIRIQENTNEKLELTINYAGIDQQVVNTQKGEFAQLVLQGSYRTGEVGKPQLPSTKKLIQVPMGADVEFSVESYDMAEYDLKDYGIDKKLIPFQPSYPKSVDPSTQEFIYKQEAYEQDAYAEMELVQLQSIGVMRGLNLAQITVNPVRYNPVKNSIKVFNNVRVTVSFKNGDAAKTKSIKAKTSSPYFNAVYNLIVNTNSGQKDNFDDNPDHTKYPVKYLIVTAPEFEEQLADFVDWKTKKGFEVIMVTTDDIGGSSAEIKAWIHGQYAAGTESDPAPTFFLLVGDTDQIPASQTGESSNKATDLYYACVDGEGDIMPDMYYGRFSAQTSEQLQNMLDKVLMYEKYEMSDPSYLNDITLIAGADGTWNPDVGQPTINYGTENYFNADHGFATVNAYLSSYSGCYDPDRIRVGMINYTAHCDVTSWADPELTISDVNSFTNSEKYPLAIGNCCLAADFGSSECIGEAWMRKADAGAVAYIGSSPSSYWYEDYYWSVGAHPYVAGTHPTFEGSTLGAYDAPYVSDYLCVDAMLFVGNLAVTEAHDQGYDSSVDTKYYWEAYNCLSDPSLFIYLTEGDDNTVTHLPTVPIGVSEYEVSAEPGSYVAISKDGILHGAAIVPESGTVIVEIEPITSGGDANIVVTKSQYKPYQITVPAAALDGPYLAVDAFNVVDGSGNDMVEPGEQFNINLSLKNVGSDISQEITASITSSDPYIESFQNNIDISFPNIPVDGTAEVTGQFNVVVKDSIPDQHVMEFAITMTDNSVETKKVYETTKTVTLNAPVLELSDLLVMDDSDGNNNGLLDPGETATLKVSISNVGHSQVSTTTYLSFSTKNPFLSILTNKDVLGYIQPEGSATAEFTVEADANTPQGTTVDVTVNAEGGETPLYLDEKQYEVVIGQVPEVIIGEGTAEAETYPLNNYYKNNKTQLLYRADEIGPGSKVITDMAFDISSATSASDDLDLANFNIRMMLTDAESLSGYVDMSEADIVFSEAPYIMTGNTGWETFVFEEPFAYDGTSNLLIEVVWGANDDFCSSSDRTKVYTSTTDVNTVAYGYSDSETPPSLSGTSAARPNLKMHVGQAHTLNFVVSEADAAEPIYIENATIVIENKEVVTDAEGKAKFVYASQQYGLNYTITALGYYQGTGTVDLDAESVTENVELTLKPRYDITFEVQSNGQAVADASVNFNDEVKSTDANGLVTFTEVIENDGYEYTVSKANYVTAEGLVNADSDKTINVVLGDDILTPAIVGVQNMREGQAELTWNAISAPDFEDDFESYDDWSRDFGEYTLIDGDGLDVFGSQDVDYPDENGATAFRIMNYTQTTPAWDGLEAYSGNKIAASFAANDGATPNGAVNDDWLITPQLTAGPGFEFSFYAKSITDQYGLERFQVAVSTTGTAVEDFTVITEGDYVEAPTTWTQFTYGLEEYLGQNIYIAIHCVSADAFVFMVDDVRCAPSSGKESKKLFEGYSVYLDDLSTPVATDVQEMSYIYSGLTNGQAYTAGVKGSYSTGESELVTYDFTYSQVYTVDFVVTIDGQPQVGVDVSFNDEIKQTNSDGIASFDLESANAVAYTISYDGYYEQSGNLDVTQDLTEDIALIFIPDVLFAVADQDNVPVEGAKVNFDGRIEYTDAAGEATFIDVDAGADQVYRVTMPGYQDAESMVTVAETDVTEAVTIHELPEITFVVKDADAQVLPGARVKFDGYTVISDADGIAVFENVEPGTDLGYRVRLDAYVTVYDTIDVDLNNQIVNVTMNEIPDVKFIVSDGDNAIEGVSISFNGSAMVTDAEGVALFADIQPGDHEYTATYEGYYEVVDTVTVALTDVEETIVMAFIPDVMFTVEYDGAPMQDAEVTMDGQTIMTNESGQAMFVDMAEGDHDYTVNYDGYYPVSGICTVGAEDVEMPIDLVMIPDVTFTINDGVDPVPGATVTLNSTTLVANESGQVTFVDVVEGKHEFTVEKDLYFTVVDSIEVGGVDINETIILELVNYAVTFNVTSGTEALEGAAVMFNGETKQTDADGVATFEGVIVANDYEYSISKDGYTGATGTVDVVDGDVTEDVALEMITYQVTFNVSDKNGAIQDAIVSFNNEEINTDGDGVALFEAVPQGEGLAYTISKTDTHNDYQGTVDLTKDTTINVNMTIIGIDEMQAQVSLYPNPTKGQVNVDITALPGSWSIKVTDQKGQLIQMVEDATPINQINLSEQAKGVYFIHIMNENNAIVRKIILE